MEHMPQELVTCLFLYVLLLYFERGELACARVPTQPSGQNWRTDLGHLGSSVGMEMSFPLGLQFSMFNGPERTGSCLLTVRGREKAVLRVPSEPSDH